ncbi:MAG: efflux RND transporter permease subunit [Candidatus Baltobacteraceae bacterium]
MSVWISAQQARKPLLFAVALLAALGAVAYVAAPQSIFPAISFARVEIFAYSGDLPPEAMRSAVTQPLEAALQSLPALHATRSYSNQGAVEIEIDFDPWSDPRADLQNVDAAIAAVRPRLRAATRIDTLIENPNMEPVVSYALSATRTSQAELRHLVEQRVVPVFTGTPGLGRVTVFGGPDVEYRVALDPRALAAARTTAGEVAQTIAEANVTAAAGTLDRGGRSRVVFVGEALDGAASLRSLAVLDRGANRFVPLSRLGTVERGAGPAIQQASFDARHAVVLSAYPAIGGDAVSLQRSVAARIPQLLEGLPPDVRIARYWDQTRLIVASQQALRDAILAGALLALVVIYAFLRSFGMTLIAAAVIPVALAITILFVERAGMSLNLMSLGGLAIAVGLIIDEVIVVIESIAREFAESPDTPRRTAIARATGRIAKPLIASTAANVVVFLPLALLSGIPGFFFRALAITLATALIVSIFLSLGVAPLVADALLRSRRPQRPGRLALEPWYARLLRWALVRRRTVFVGGGLVLSATIVLVARLPSDFLPALEEGEFEIKYTLPPGTSLTATDRIATQMERIVLNDPSVEGEGRLTGIDTNGLVPTPQNAGTIRVALRAQGADPFADVSGRLRDALGKAVPGADFEFHQLLEDQINDLSGAPEPIQLAVSGPDQATLIGIADRLTDRIGKIPGVVDPFDGVIDGNETIRVTPKTDGPGAIALGTLSGALSARIGGIVATELSDGDTTVPVRVSVGGGAPGSLDRFAIPTARGPLALGTVATIGKPSRSSEVLEQNGARMLLVTAGIEDANLSAVIPRVQEAIAATPLPPGYRIELGGAYQAQQASFREFAAVLGVAVLLVFLVLLAAFNSFRLPLVILATIPLSPIGVALALALTGTPINVSSFMGLLLLVGIVVRNGVLLIDAANRRRMHGATVHEALIGAGTERLRPILMTTFAAIGGLLPLALGFGSGSEMERPLAIAVIGGLSTATAFTLVLIPVLYAGAAGMIEAAPLALLRLPDIRTGAEKASHSAS